MNSEWHETTWGEVATLEYGKAIRNYQNALGDFPVYGTNGPIGWHHTPLCPSSGVVIGRKGAYRGIHYSKKPFYVIDTAFYLKPKKDFLNTKWAYYCLLTYDINGMDSGSAIPSTSRDEFYKLPIRLPSLSEQNRIAALLSTFDERIALLRETNTTLEAIAQALFKSWFVDFDPVRAKQENREPEGMDPTTAALFPDSFEESELSIVPKGWKIGSLAELMDIAGGTQPPAKEFIEQPRPGYVRLIQIRDYETESHLTYIPDTTKLRKTTVADIMIARYGASVGRICWGLDGAYNVALVRVVSDEHSREFLRSYLKSDIFQARLSAVSGRSAQAGFNKGDIASFVIVIPPGNLLKEYNEIAWQLRQSILEKQKLIKTLDNLRDTLLPRLISGQLRLSDADALVEEAAA